jgi:hypothetical protein
LPVQSHTSHVLGTHGFSASAHTSGSFKYSGWSNNSAVCVYWYSSFPTTLSAWRSCELTNCGLLELREGVGVGETTGVGVGETVGVGNGLKGEGLTRRERRERERREKGREREREKGVTIYNKHKHKITKKG